MKRKLSLLLALCCAVLLAVGTLAYASEIIPGDSTEVAGGEALFYQVGEIAVSIDTTANVRSILEGDSSSLRLLVESISGITTANYTFSGLMPLTTYYVYVDNLHGGQEIVSDETGKLFWTQLLDQPHMIIIKDQPSTNFISATEWIDSNGVLHPAGWSYSDGTDLNGILGTWDAATLTATMLSDADEQIQIMSNFIVLDGAGYTLSQTSSASGNMGVYASNIYRAEIKNLNFQNWPTGVSLYNSSRITVSNNVFQGNGRHVFLNRSQSNQIINNTFDGGLAVRLYPISYGSNISNNVMKNGVGFVSAMGLTGSYTFKNNTIENIIYTAFSFYNSRYNVIAENTINGADRGVYYTGSGTNARSSYNRTFNNNFINVAWPIREHNAYNNSCNEPLPVGGNYYNDWVSPDDNFDGIVDTPRPIYDYYGELANYDNFPYTRKNGWVDNQAPEFTAIPPVEAVEYDQISIPLTITDPENDSIISIYAENMPTGATLDSASRQFNWRPNGTQAGVYVVSFFATDNGTPAATGQIDLVITVGEVASPIDLNATIDAEVQTLELLPEVANSYTANLQSADDMIDKGNITAVVNQYKVVIHKIQQDLKQNKIDQADADILTMMVSDAISLLD